MSSNERRSRFGPHQAFVDAGGDRYAQAHAGRLGQQRHRLAGMAHDKRRLGVAVRFLMEAFDPRHFAALLGAFEAIDQKHQAAVLAHQAPAQKVADGDQPGGRQSLQRKGG